MVLWQRVGARFSTGRSASLRSGIGGGLGLDRGSVPGSTRKSNGNRGVWSPRLERLDAAHRAKIGTLIERVRREPQCSLALGDRAARRTRVPLYGPLDSVVAAAVAERWMDAELKEMTPDVAGAMAEEIGAAAERSRARNLSAAVVAAAIARLDAAGRRPQANVYGRCRDARHRARVWRVTARGSSARLMQITRMLRGRGPDSQRSPHAQSTRGPLVAVPRRA